jgi:hypothetical protein
MPANDAVEHHASSGALRASDLRNTKISETERALER